MNHWKKFVIAIAALIILFNTFTIRVKHNYVALQKGLAGEYTNKEPFLPGISLISLFEIFTSYNHVLMIDKDVSSKDITVITKDGHTIHFVAEGVTIINQFNNSISAKHTVMRFTENYESILFWQALEGIIIELVSKHDINFVLANFHSSNEELKFELQNYINYLCENNGPHIIDLYFNKRPKLPDEQTKHLQEIRSQQNQRTLEVEIFETAKYKLEKDKELREREINTTLSLQKMKQDGELQLLEDLTNKNAELKIVNTTAEANALRIKNEAELEGIQKKLVLDGFKDWDVARLFASNVKGTIYMSNKPGSLLEAAKIGYGLQSVNGDDPK